MVVILPIVCELENASNSLKKHKKQLSSKLMFGIMCEGSGIMSKIMFTPRTITEVRKSMPYVDAYLFGISGLSTNLEVLFKLEVLRPIIKELMGSGKEVFISLNKNMHTSDLEALKETLKGCEALSITGIIFYDISILKMKKDGVFDLPLVWHQEHLTTNYATCNFWCNQGVATTILSSEITLKEIMEIRAKTKVQLVVPIFGYLPMFVSKRNLVKNYLETFSFPINTDTYLIEKEGYEYPIVNTENKTEVYSSYILNGLKEKFLLQDLGIDYFLVSSFHISEATMIKILAIYHMATKETADEMESEIDTLLEGNTEKGFFYRKTVFRVKKHEK